jgi:hypothetical protein
MLTHLIELTRNIDVADPGWEVAWIGIYQHRFARIIFFCSAIVAPPLTVFLIAHKSVTLSVNTTRSALIEAWVTMIVGGLISVIIALITLSRFSTNRCCALRRGTGETQPRQLARRRPLLAARFGNAR